MINEGIIEIPENLIDRSVNMLMSVDGKKFHTPSVEINYSQKKI